tara:strand:+ start:20 stop:274 length:255 start_codon:yes stop_codon:yes gene_type:complete
MTDDLENIFEEDPFELFIEEDLENKINEIKKVYSKIKESKLEEHENIEPKLIATMKEIVYIRQYLNTAVEKMKEAEKIYNSLKD